uniref:MATE family efflux transporter n=1 Tax=Thaumasiovibrio occultus TaxID=1891184 RepID=UPI000B353646|nr:MATE family efflux transporter [Thaumasiovibrio occultus]
MPTTQAKFLTGNLMRHIVVMSTTSAVGIMAIFLVDLADMFFISLLGETELAAAIGFAGTLVFFSTSAAIGCSIAMGALMSRSIGAGEKGTIGSIYTSNIVFALLISSAIALVMLLNLDFLLALLGAEAHTAEVAKDYLYILMPSSPFVAVSMSCGAAMRAVGDARRAMIATLIGAGVNAVFDPLLIFGLGLGIQGAAIASVIARAGMLVYSVYVLTKHYQMKPVLRLSALRGHLTAISSIAFPAMLANTATPIGNAFVTRAIAPFGEEAVAGYAVIGRILPVAFALIFALSGAIGPIIGQNFGAKRFDRVEQALKDSLVFMTLYCIVTCISLYLLQDVLIAMFNLGQDAAVMVNVFCTFVALSFIFNGALFIANAAFNNLNLPSRATMLNMGKATLGTLPFIWFGAQWGGAPGVLVGQAVGAVLFGILGIAWLLSELRQVRKQTVCEQSELVLEPAIPLTPFCSSRAYHADDGLEEAEQTPAP